MALFARTEFKEWLSLHETKEALEALQREIVNESLGLRKLDKEERDERVPFINGIEYAANVLKDLGRKEEEEDN